MKRSRASGARRLYGLRGEGFAELARWLTPYVVLWQGGLKALEAHLAEQGPAGALPYEVTLEAAYSAFLARRGAAPEPGEEAA